MLKQGKHFPENWVNFQEAMQRDSVNRYVDFYFCFDGIPKHGLVPVSSDGIWCGKAFLRFFKPGLEAMIEKIDPAGIVFYGKLPEFNFGGNRKGISNNFFSMEKSAKRCTL